MPKEFPKNHVFAGGPHIMGVVNVTPDSFSDGGKYINQDKAIEHGIKLVHQGATILDVGGESTRPGSQAVDVEEEIARVVPVLRGLKGRAPWISIDTRNARTMEAALAAGANCINDISALRHDPSSVGLLREARVPVFIMHMNGTPQTMQKNILYNNVLKDIFNFLEERISFCETNRIAPEYIVCDPGIGFGKTVEQNISIIRNINKFHGLNVPVLLGVSRKSFIGAVSGAEDPSERLPGSLACALWGLSQGVQIFRVHDVAETVQAFKLHQAILSAGPDENAAMSG